MPASLTWKAIALALLAAICTVVWSQAFGRTNAQAWVLGLAFGIGCALAVMAWFAPTILMLILLVTAMLFLFGGGEYWLRELSALIARSGEEVNWVALLVCVIAAGGVIFALSALSHLYSADGTYPYYVFIWSALIPVCSFVVALWLGRSLKTLDVAALVLVAVGAVVLATPPQVREQVLAHLLPDRQSQTTR